MPGILITLLGISRFRLFGTVVPVFPSDPDAIIDLAHVSSGGLAISCSEQHFGTKTANLLLPGRGKDAGNGWETRRSREPGHVDWVVVKLVRIFPWTSRNSLATDSLSPHRGLQDTLKRL